MVQLVNIMIFIIIAFRYCFFQIASKYFISNFNLKGTIQYFPKEKLKEVT